MIDLKLYIAPYLSVVKAKDAVLKPSAVFEPGA